MLSGIRTSLEGQRIFARFSRDRTRLLVPARDEAALRGAIELLESVSALKMRLGRNARNRFESRETVLESLRRFYASDLGCGVDRFVKWDWLPRLS